MSTEYELLERRVYALEQEVEGEKVVTRYILEQTRRNGDDLAAVRKQLARVEAQGDKVAVDIGREVGGLGRDVGSVRAELRSLRAELPSTIAETMREVLRERDR